MFWLRFLGSRTRDNNAHSAFTFFKPEKTEAKLKLFDNDISQTSPDSVGAVNEGDYPAPELKPMRGGRRSAIDLGRNGYSLDIGPQTMIRLSLDMFNDPSYQLSTMLKGYTDITTLHRGSHARILKAQKKGTNERVVFKLYDKSSMRPSQLEDALKEMDVLKKGTELGTVPLMDVFDDERLLIYSMKESARGHLMACIHDHGGSMTEAACVRLLAAPVTKILQGLHESGIVHRDLKPEHILFGEQNEPCLCDFYSAGVVGRDAFTEREGTLSYMAPEMLAKPTPEEIFNIVLSNGFGESELPSYNEKVDIWSFGVTIVEALTGRVPFVSNTPEGMVKVHADHFSGHRPSTTLKQLEASGDLSPEGLDFLSKIFQLDPNDRATATDLIYHPWLQQAYAV